MGPLKGVRVLEMSNIGPGPFCGMLLSDLGADVLRVDRLVPGDLGFAIDPRFDLLHRGKQAIAIDLKHPDGVATVRGLARQADLLIEGYRPGVMEKLGLGPDPLLSDNPRLVYGRMTGWGQQGSYAAMAGHDINYIGVAGALAGIGPKDGDPVPPLNLVGDFAGGSLYLAMGLLAALLETRRSGRGQVVDAAMVDGISSMMAMHLGFRQAGIWNLERGSNAVDGGAPYYACYRTKDGKYMAAGAVELRFYRIMIDRLGLDLTDLPDRDNPACWDELRAILQERFASRTRGEWTEIFDGSDACVTPVYDLDEAPDSPLAQERGLFLKPGGITMPAPAPRFGRTPPAEPEGTVDPASATHISLADWGIGPAEISRLAADGIIPPS
ncbi:CaiB/BaiF CoA-transferase family protein [Tsuneonella sp. CC-YZS046]|uniref:CaiB/BaiF CoA transferase family protein n=1 Tax=Tsuneonella sp. CC-YZS046 TaxID=3042152 RepID=UPI002D7788AC|nr:CaiB/BaiF CoA-transferase family protein [Tsuneonella sp. CC-YZS046]WRO65340.1 CaiB/BaiF CoA-transferase family protein [Tsuneonella sp. CC-YZS046]